MAYSRREFGKLALAGLPASSLWIGSTASLIAVTMIQLRQPAIAQSGRATPTTPRTSPGTPPGMIGQ